MANTSGTTGDLPVIRAFTRGVDQGDLTDVKVTIVFTGGIPEERLNRTIVVGGRRPPVGELLLTVPGVSEPQHLTKQIDGSHANEILADLRGAVSDLIPTRDAQLPFDSAVGIVRMEAGGREDTFCFLSDERQFEEAMKRKYPAALKRLMEAVDRTLPATPLK